jgi:hypothetical protein
MHASPTIDAKAATRVIPVEVELGHPRGEWGQHARVGQVVTQNIAKPESGQRLRFRLRVGRARRGPSPERGAGELHRTELDEFGRRRGGRTKQAVRVAPRLRREYGPEVPGAVGLEQPVGSST